MNDDAVNRFSRQNPAYRPPEFFALYWRNCFLNDREVVMSFNTGLYNSSSHESQKEIFVIRNKRHSITRAVDSADIMEKQCFESLSTAFRLTPTQKSKKFLFKSNPELKPQEIGSKKKSCLSKIKTIFCPKRDSEDHSDHENPDRIYLIPVRRQPSNVIPKPDFR